MFYYDGFIFLFSVLGEAGETIYVRDENEIPVSIVAAFLAALLPGTPGVPASSAATLRTNRNRRLEQSRHKRRTDVFFAFFILEIM